MSHHERSKQNKHVAFFKPKPLLVPQERVTKDLDKLVLNDEGMTSPRVLSHDLYCRFAGLAPKKIKDNTIKRELKQGKR